MATVTPPAPVRSRSLADAHRRVRSPLARLRGYIRAYVGLESAALVVLFLATWFWVGLLLDYGVFKAFEFDWVQEAPWAVRLAVLVLLSAALVALVAIRLTTRLTREFTDQALALVLERRFPALLGDRLITAVELSDPEKAAEFGYSPVMVRETIHEAAERVNRAPVGRVFDWRRVWFRAALCVGLTLVLYVLAGGLFAALDAVWGVTAGQVGYGRFNETAQIWFERNVLLQNSVWPRAAQLEVVNYPDDYRLSKESPAPPSIRVRALKYVVADNSTYDGWRAATWEELRGCPDLLGGATAPAAFTAWAPRDPDLGLTADEVELRLRPFDVRHAVNDAGLKTLRLADAKAADGWREFRWAELKPDHLVGFEPPDLPQEWYAHLLSAGKGAPAAPPAEVKGDAGLRLEALGLAAGLGGRYALTSHDAPDNKAADRAAAKESVAPDGSAAKQRHGDLGVDEVIARLDKVADGKRDFVKDVDVALSQLDRRADLHEALEALDRQTARPEMSRRLRKLVVPDQLSLQGYGSKKGIKNPLLPAGDNEFVGEFGKLDESITYRVRAENYSTGRRSVTLVSPPNLVKLEAEEQRPAYLYYRPNYADPAASLADLTGKKQSFVAHDVLSGGEKMKVEVPAGTDLRLIGKADKDLDVKKIVLAAPPKSDAVVTQTAALRADRRTFTIDFTDVQKDVTFDLKFTDLDGVEGKRTITVAPQTDNPPNLPEVLVEKMRKVTKKEGKGEKTYYMVTKKARIPFSAKIDDDHALTDVRYRYTIGREGGDPLVGAAFRVPGLLLLTPNLGAGLMDTRLQAAAYLSGQEDLDSRQEERALNLKNVRYYSLPQFTRTLHGTDFEFEPMSDVRESLGKRLSWDAPKDAGDDAKKPPYHRLLREFKIKPDEWTYSERDNKNAENGPLDCDFPLFEAKLWPMDAKGDPLYPADPSHPHLRLNLSVEALDNNGAWSALGGFSSDGQVGSSKERFPFLIVTENELLVEIGQEEVEQYKLLYVKYNELEQKRSILETAVFNIRSGAGVDKKDLDAPIKRADEIQTALDTSFNVAKTVLTNYQRILREEQLNQVKEDVVARVQGIVKPLPPAEGVEAEGLGLDDLVNGKRLKGPGAPEVGFPATQKALEDWKSALDDAYANTTPERLDAAKAKGKFAQEKLDRLTSDLHNVLAAMAGLIGKNELINMLTDIEKDVRVQEQRAKEIKERLEDALFPTTPPPK